MLLNYINHLQFIQLAIPINSKICRSSFSDFEKQVILTICLLFVIIIRGLLTLVQLYIEEKQFLQDRLLLRIEAGFEKQIFKRHISSPYFLIVILYVLFDVELVVLFPILLKSINTTSSFVGVNILLFVVIVTLVAE